MLKIDCFTRFFFGKRKQKENLKGKNEISEFWDFKIKRVWFKKNSITKILYLIQVIANNIEIDASNFLFACLIYSQIRLNFLWMMTKTMAISQDWPQKNIVGNSSIVVNFCAHDTKYLLF